MLELPKTPPFLCINDFTGSVPQSQFLRAAEAMTYLTMCRLSEGPQNLRAIATTVKPVYKDHPNCQRQVVAGDRWSFLAVSPLIPPLSLTHLHLPELTD